MRLGLAVWVSLAVCFAASAARADDARWIRYPAISPDGAQVAFAYRGDLWVVPVNGGRARQLTTHAGYETRPVWSPDGSRIAFASDRYGNFDVFLMSAQGGAATRLTFHSADDLPCDFVPGGGGIYFTSHRQDAPESILGTPYHPELHVVSTAGGRTRMVLTTPAEWVRASADGRRVAYQDVKGYEDQWRKHHVSPVTRDIWIWDTQSGAHERVTTFAGEDRNPAWAADGGGLYFLSERDGSFDVYLRADDSGEITRVTSHGPHPVRFLTAADNGTLCYGYAGELWVKPAVGEPRRVLVDVVADARRNPREREILRDGATEMAVSPDEDEVAFVVKGEVFVASVEHGTTKRLTHTPEQERSISWAPDGKHLYYAGERDGSWNLYRISPKDPAEERFFLSTVLIEEPVLVDDSESFQPVVSPDGKSIAFLRDRDSLALLDLATRRVGVLVPGERNYSYADGDIRFSWSPDSQWIAATYLSRKSWIENIGVVSARSGDVRDVTLSGYYEGDPQWSRDGRALLFASNRAGRRSHGSWGSDDDVFALYLTQESFDRASLDEEELEVLLAEEEDQEEADAPGGGAAGGNGKRKKKEDEPPPVVRIEEGRYAKRTKRLTLHSSPISRYVLSNDGEALVYFAQVEQKWDVWMSRPRKGESRRLLSLGDDRAGDLTLSKDGKTLFIRRGNGKLARADVGGALASEGGRGGRGRRGGGDGGGGGDLEGIGYAAELSADEAAVRKHLFEHVWRQAGEKFYDPGLHGVDWPALRADYAAFLPHIENDRDFAEMLSEMLGELNASHTGCRYRPSRPDGDATASLGLLYDTAYEGPGLRVAEVIAGGPCARADSKVREGDVVTHIDGVELSVTTNPWPLLDHKAGKRVRLTLRAASGTMNDQVLKAISSGRERQLLYERLVERRRQIVAEASGGRLGYVHVRGMNDGSFRTLFREALGRHGDAEGLVVDTRFNGGGWLHDDLVVFLSGTPYAEFVPRGKERGQMGGEPLHRWARPSVVLQSEGNYSDAHIFPWAYKHHGLGKLVGTGVAGTGTAVWWERLMEPALVFGIPQVGMMTPDGEYLENQTLEPDVLVFNEPQQVARGVDQQLLEAVKVLLAEIDDR